MNCVKTTVSRALAGLLLSTCVGAALAASMTVNPGQSIQAAIDQANAGDTIRVLAGTYAQTVSISGKSGTASALITLKGDPGAIISGSGLTPSGRQGLITIRNSNYVRVEGFDVTGFTSSGSNTPVGILVEGNGAKLQIVNNKIHDIRNTSTCKDPCSVGAHGLAVFGTNATGVTYLLVQGNEVYKNVLQASEALVINGNVDRFEVLNNNVHDNNNIGFDFIGYEGECSGCGENDRVRNGMVRNNVAQNNSSTSNPWYGGEGSAGGFYVDGGRNIIFDRNISSGNGFSNNIFYGEGTIAENYVVEGSGHSGNVWGVNLWWGSASGSTNLPGTQVKADPRYVAPQSGNLNLQQTSPAINVGNPGAALTTWTSPLWATYFPSGAIPVNGVKDINGQARVEGVIDLGADEYGTAP